MMYWYAMSPEAGIDLAFGIWSTTSGLSMFQPAVQCTKRTGRGAPGPSGVGRVVVRAVICRGASCGVPKGAGAKRRYLLYRERRIIREMPATGICKPGRHRFLLRRIANGGCKGANLLICFQRHGCHLPSAMARLAVLLQDREPILIKGRLSARGWQASQQDVQPCLHVSS